ncbi:hypothetical protein MXM74_04965 [Staphylococcus xylosus]|uniref:DUF6731 family protein n=1 Tax=Staphylococcus xylosus TaxID=1288 RepID=UPI002DB666D5|nr:DUF6731 family protein [Staphylococcus xylosus]MEB6320277.1 hypothetical protein [Staphylococcus xylosus]
MVRKTKKTFEFFKLSFRNDEWEEHDYSHINTYFKNVSKQLIEEGNDVDFIELNDEIHIGINKIEEYRYDNSKVWVLCLSKVNTTKLAVVSDVEKQVKKGREEYGDDTSKGLTTDTVILMCPKTGLVIIPRNNGGITQKNLKDFINIELATTGSTLSVIINGTKVSNLSSIDEIKEVQVNVVRSIEPNKYKNPRNSKRKDDEIMDFLGGEKMNLVMKSSSLNKRRVIKYFEELLKSRKKKTNKFVVIGEHDGHEQIIDLITNRLIYFDDVHLNEKNKLTINSMFESIKKAYRDNKRIVYLDIFRSE